jgi:starch phosphorylase
MESIKDPFYRYLRYLLAKDDTTATKYDKYMALAYSVRSEMMDDWIETQRRYHEGNVRRVYFLSTEYVIGRSLKQNLVNIGIERNVSEVARKLGFVLDDIYNKEDEYDLGNGSKGRLAACLLDSMAAMSIPAIGYGVRYDFAHFRQEIRNGMQYEYPYDWLHKGHPWEIIRPEYTCEVQFGGECAVKGTNGQPQDWKPSERVHAVPYDLPIPGYRNGTVNTLRLWSARASEEFNADYLNHGDYIRACDDKGVSGTLTRILYPDENVLRATEQRLKQQFFFVSASLQDIVRRFKVHNPDIREFDKKVIIQLNGSGCALAIPELMRLLVDAEKLPWDEAWRIVQHSFAYTSHALRKDDLESWPVYMMAQLFPRHLGIIFEINQRHLDVYRSSPGARFDLVPELSLIEEGEVKRIRTAHMAILGSSTINGVSRVQSDALKKKVFSQFGDLFTEKFRCVTGGVAHRRWLLNANPPLSRLITDLIGDLWIRNPSGLSRLEQFADENDILCKLTEIKRSAKQSLAGYVKEQLQIDIDPEALFDIQCGKIHPSKRQTLNLLGILSRHLRIKKGEPITRKRVYIFSGKAVPSDRLAKQMIQLIHIVGNLIKNDPVTGNLMSVVFIPDHSVTRAERIIPAADVSEQIPSPQFEPSGTTGMKFALNGAVTVASLAGSNLEMIERIGAENILTFGTDGKENGGYKPYEVIKSNPQLAAAFKLLDELLPMVPNAQTVYPLLASLRDTDEFYALRDFAAYEAIQDKVDQLYQNPENWQRLALCNIARSGWFSSDRAISEYSQDIWKVTPVK